jgi:hypothetical protein
VYQTRADRLGYGRDYTPVELVAGEKACGAYAGRQVQPDGEEALTDRGEFVRGMGVSGLTVMLDRSSSGAMRLARKLGASNLGPVTLEQLELRVAKFAQAEAHTPVEQLFAEVLAQQEKVEALLDGAQPLRQRRQLHRIAGQVSLLLGHLA